MSISLRGFEIRMPEQLANDRQVETGSSTDACEGVPQIMKPETCQISSFGNQPPRSLKVRTWLVGFGTGDDKLSDARRVFQNRQRR
jgi:hypothetical protein